VSSILPALASLEILRFPPTTLAAQDDGWLDLVAHLATFDLAIQEQIALAVR